MRKTSIKLVIALAALAALPLGTAMAQERLLDRFSERKAENQGFFAQALRETMEDSGTLVSQPLLVNGRHRSYIAVVPPRVARAGKKVPLVIMLHGGGGNAKNGLKMSGFASLAASENFIAVFPDGAGRNSKVFLTWNAGHCCAYAMESNSDDVAFISALIDEMVKTQPVDPTRVFVTGMSNGAMMAHRIGRELSGKVRAIAPVVGGLFGDEPPPAGPVSALIINGASDESVPPAGGPLSGKVATASDGTHFRPAAYQAEYWAKANGCNPQPAQETLAGGTLTLWRYTCPGGHNVVRYMVNDGGHSWPGGKKGRESASQPSESLDATKVIWEFFKSQ